MGRRYRRVKNISKRIKTRNKKIRKTNYVVDSKFWNPKLKYI